MQFRRLNDPDGDCATVCTVIFDQAKSVATALGTVSVDQSRWHVYANMEHVIHYLEKSGLPHDRVAYPQTEDILSCSMNITVCNVAAGPGAGFGININGTDREIRHTAQQFIDTCQ